jgi:uroporphyrinogen decarboxylase
MPTTEEMTHWERIRAVLRGEKPDRPPISLWRHWPVKDETAEGLAEVMLNWQKEYDFDLVKFMPTGTYGIEDWGARTTYVPNDHGVRTVTQYGITDPAEWPTLNQLDVTCGYLGRQVDAIRLAAGDLETSVPILQTVFSPLTTARKLAGDRVFADLRCRPDVFKQGLQIIAETTARFALESLRAGAHGIFFATQCATYRLLSETEYREFGQAYDRTVLDAVRPEAEFILLHAHGYDLMFDLLVDYEPHALNWHDREAGPSLAEAQARFDGVVVGGISEWETLLKGPPDAIRAEIGDAVAQTAGRRHIVGPGCVLSTETPARHVHVAREAVASV